MHFKFNVPYAENIRIIILFKLHIFFNSSREYNYIIEVYFSNDEPILQ